MGSSRISVSVVLYKTSLFDIHTLYESVSGSSIDVTLYLIDNSPTPCLDPDAFPKAEYIFVGRNLGYGSGHNVAIRKTIERGGVIHFVVNPDVSFDRNVLAMLVDFLDRTPDVGQVMPAVFSEDGILQRLCRLLPTPTYLFLRRFPLPLFSRFIARMDRRNELRFWSYATIESIPALSGCFMGLRVSTLQQAGLFDQRYFMYLEDFDLTRRMAERSEVKYYPLVSITHRHAKESFKSWKMTFIHMRSAVQYFNKWGWFFDTKRRKSNNAAIARLSQERLT